MVAYHHAPVPSVIGRCGGHDDAGALLEAYEPPHDVIRTTLDELLANPLCSEELPRVRYGMMSWAMRPDVAMPATIVQHCDGSFQIDIQNERVRFGAGCGRASATAFVPVFYDGASEWTAPYLIRFLLTKSDDGWLIDEAVDIQRDDPRDLRPTRDR